MSGQTSYTRNTDVAVAGIPIDSQEGTVKKTFYNPNAAIAFGVFAARITGTARNIQLPSSLADDIVCVTERYLPEEEAGAYPQNASPVGIVRGPIWVRVEADVTPDMDVYVDCVGANPGYARGDNGVIAQAAATSVQIPNARFDGPSITGRDGIKIAPLYLNMD